MMTRTPDEIKKGLEYISIKDVARKLDAWEDVIPYDYVEDAAADALALIQQLEAQNTEKDARIQQLEKRVIHLEALNQSNLSIITMQERTRDRLQEQISKLEAERDAALSDFKSYRERNIRGECGVYACDLCKHGGEYEELEEIKCPEGCMGIDHWEWRGVQKEDMNE